MRPAKAGSDRNALVLGLAVSIGGFFAAFLFSLYPNIWGYLPAQLQIIQFPFRLITYCNLFLLTALLLLMRLRREWFEAVLQKRWAVGAVVGLVSLSLVSHMTKLVHVGATKTQMALVGRVMDPSFEIAPDVYKFYHHYVTPLRWQNLASQSGPIVRGAFKVGRQGSRFGEVVDLDLSLTHDSWVATTAAAFPWNKLELDGRIVPDTALRYFHEGLAVYVPTGRHRLHLTVVPDPAWLVLRRLSFAAMGLGFLALVLGRKRSWLATHFRK